MCNGFRVYAGVLVPKYLTFLVEQPQVLLVRHLRSAIRHLILLTVDIFATNYHRLRCLVHCLGRLNIQV